MLGLHKLYNMSINVLGQVQDPMYQFVFSFLTAYSADLGIKF